ncbi:MAG: UvrB/UvrC motif-containing protein [Planctomycetia bacterium]|nr:UvrB/UvrC motif-containing protein [Planctomycetia bacterium]
MKCQKCNNPATFHITEMTGDKPVELHLCDKHADEYLHHANDKGSSLSVDDLEESQETAEDDLSPLQKETNELKELDFQTCPVCGISFQDFRKTARLGCPNDYKVFENQILPLLQKIHGAQEHLGKKPSRAGNGETQLMLIRLKREMNEAIAIEDYERASTLRDRINDLSAEKS